MKEDALQVQRGGNYAKKFMHSKHKVMQNI